MDLGLSGKVAIVTAAARNIGYGIAVTLAEEGATVILNDLDGPAAEAVAIELTSKGHQASAMQADVSDFNQVTTMMNQTINKFGKIDILVNNAGTLWTDEGRISGMHFPESGPELWAQYLGIGFVSVLNCTRAVVEHMIPRQSGKIVNISSVAYRIGHQRTTIYGASKGAIVSFTRALAADVGENGINVNCVAPGTIQRSDPQWNKKNKPLLDKIAGLTALGKVGMPRDVGLAVAFLASEAANHITGTTLDVDGGFPVIRR